MENEEKVAFEVEDNSIFGKKIVSSPLPQKEIGIDNNDTILSGFESVNTISDIDTTSIESFSRISQNRDQIYNLIDTMAEDSIVSAILETYAEDTTEYNEKGDIVWVESNKDEVTKYVSYLLNSMQVDKNIYKWAYSLIKYGDLYLKLYRQSEYADDLFSETKNKSLHEDIFVNRYSTKDNYVHYVEMVSNPAEMFELCKFGKSYAYIRADVRTPTQRIDAMNYTTFKYNFNKSDINIYGPTEFVHASLEDDNVRVPEEVSIFRNQDDLDKGKNALNYKVRKGQSILYNSFKIWRELTLLENAILLNRVTKSSLVRLVQVEVGDMPKESVGPYLQRIKQMIEQKSALNEGKSIAEYTNPGPVENSVYIPTHNGQGAITLTNLGEDVDVKGLADIDYFKNRFFGSLKVPKQYFGETDDSTGFNGGTSLSLISSRYAKAIKRIQNTLTQAITDCVNIMLLDKGLDSYVNNFTIKMLPPTTQEEVDRRDNQTNKVGMVNDIMNALGDIEDPIVKLKLVKSLLSGAITDYETLDIIQDEIDRLESEQENDIEEDEMPMDMGEEPTIDNIGGSPSSQGSDINPNSIGDIGGELPNEPMESGEGSSDSDLPSPSDLGQDFTDNTQF